MARPFILVSDVPKLCVSTQIIFGRQDLEIDAPKYFQIEPLDVERKQIHVFYVVLKKK